MAGRADRGTAYRGTSSTCHLWHAYWHAKVWVRSKRTVEHPAATEPAATAAALAVLIEPLFAVLVVDLPLVVVGQHLIRCAAHKF